MAKQGEAYVEIRADFDKFGKDLDRGLKAMVTKFERELNKDLGKRIGGQVGSGAKEGLQESLTDIGKVLDEKIGQQTTTRVRNSGRRTGRSFGRGMGDGLSEIGPIRKGLANLVSALEDGFSALPAEIKAIVGGLIVAAIIPAGALIGGAFVGAVVLAVSTLGAVLSYQFEEVESRAQTFVKSLRERFVNASSVFIGPVIKAFDIWEYRLALLEPTLESVFARAAYYVEPLATAISNLVGNSLAGLDKGLAAINSVKLSDTLVRGFTDLGTAVGELFENILSNDDAIDALDDLFTVAVGAVKAIDWLTNALLDLWAVTKQVIEVVVVTVDWFGRLIDLINAVTSISPDIDEISNAWDRFTYSQEQGTEHLIKNAEGNRILQKEIKGTIKATEEEEKAQKELNKQLDAQLKLIDDLITTNVDYEESIDETNEGLKKTKGNINADTEAGRDNIRNIQERINNLKNLVNTQVATGEKTEVQAREFYNREIKRLKDEFVARGGNLKQFEEIFGALAKLNSVPPAPDKFGPFKISLADTLALMNAVLLAANTLAKQPAPKPITPKFYGPQAYADGGRITSPTFAMMGEGYQPELVLPERQPRRSAQILANSPLADSLMGNTSIAVFIGDEQLTGRMYRVAKSVNAATSRTLGQKPRNI